MVTDSGTKVVAETAAATGVGVGAAAPVDDEIATVAGARGAASAAVPAMGAATGADSFTAHPSLPRNWMDGRRANRIAVGIMVGCR